MWEWFTTKPFVDGGQARFVRHALFFLAVRPKNTAVFVPPPICAHHHAPDVLHHDVLDWKTTVDRLSTHAMAVVVDRRSSIARPCAIRQVARIPRSPVDVCDRIRCAREPGWAERRVYQGDVWLS
jgi:hypothetical protein